MSEDQQELLLPCPAHFSFAECRWFLDRGLDDCLHRIENGRITKAIWVNETPVLIELSGNEQQLHIRILEGLNDRETRSCVRAYVQEWLDLDRDLTPFYDALGRSNDFAYMSSAFYGLRSIGIPDLFEAICWAIIGQQINLTFAYRLKRRLVERFGSSIEHNGEIYYLFPKPEQLVNATIDELRAMQFSSMKAQYIGNIANAFAVGTISKELLQALPGFEARQKALIALKGVGVWTANYALMKSMKEMNAVPFGDAGLNNALLAHKIIEQKTDHEGILKAFQPFMGWESYLVFYLWRSLSKERKMDG